MADYYDDNFGHWDMDDVIDYEHHVFNNDDPRNPIELK